QADGANGALACGEGKAMRLAIDFHAFCIYRLRWPNTRSPRRALAIRGGDVYITSSSADAPAGTRFGVFGAMPLATPHYLIDEAALDRNLARVDRLRAASGAKCLMALKAFATWSTFAQIAPHMDGSTSSSLNEVKLGREKFGGETHAYSVACSDGEID